MQDLKYTNEFLKNLEPIIQKNDLTLLNKIKKVLEEISEEKIVKKALVNIKTHGNNEVFQTKIEEKKLIYSVFWTEENSEKTIIALLNRKIADKIIS